MIKISVEIFDRSENRASRPSMYYNLDVIISVGYRVKSKRGIAFKKWANSVLKEYIIKGYAVNHNRMNQLNEVIRVRKRVENSFDIKLLGQFIIAFPVKMRIQHLKKKLQIFFILSQRTTAFMMLML